MLKMRKKNPLNRTYKKSHKEYVIGVDGGGTKTIAVLADLKGRILKTAETGPSSFVKVGLKKSVLNISDAIHKVLPITKKKEILSTFIALAAVEENKEYKNIIKKELFFETKISQIFNGKVTIESDQIAAFRSGTNKKDGVVLISGTGSVAHGWRGKKESHVSGWGWLADEGSAFWVGQKAYQAVFKELDGRGKKTLITNLLFKKFKTKKPGVLKKRIYLENNIIKNVSLLSRLVDKASKKGDMIAKEILINAGEELSLTAITTIKELGLEQTEFPLVLAGGMFKCSIVLRKVKKEIKKIASGVKFIRAREPVIGAVKLAIEQI